MWLKVLFLNIFIISCVNCDLNNTIAVFCNLLSKNFDAKGNLNNTNPNSKHENSPNISYLEINDTESSYEKIFKELTDLLKDEIPEGLVIKTESNYESTVNNNTEIRIKTYELGDVLKQIVLKSDNDASNIVMKLTNIKNNSIIENLNMSLLNVPMKINYVNGTIQIITNVKTEEKSNDSNKTYLENKDNVSVNEIEASDDFDIYEIELTDDNSTDYPIIDYVDLYKDTTNEDVEYNPTEPSDTEQESLGHTSSDHVSDSALNMERKIAEPGENLEDNGSCHGNETTKSIEEVIFPWIAAIFVRNGSTNQFEYICDGAIVDRHSILTAARCLMNSPNDTVIPADVIAILGKRSLQTMDDNDVKRIKVIKIHENFLNHEDKVENDLAILVTEEEITFSPRVQTACVLKDPGEVKDAVSTGWRFSGELIAIHFNKQTDTSCLTTATDNIFCSRYGFDVSTCPSFGGLYVVKQQENVWYLSGILSEDPTNRGLCINRSLRYTYIVKYIDWIETNIS